MTGRTVRRSRGALVAAVGLGLLLVGVGWWSARPTGSYSGHLGVGPTWEECLCVAPPTPRQLAAQSDLVVVGTITAERTAAVEGGADYTLGVSRVLLPSPSDAVTELTVHVSGRTGCCRSDGPLPMNSQQVLFLTRKDPDTFTIADGGGGRLSVRTSWSPAPGTA